ncbi:UNVERIFIED_CONTAM: hypothetical protein Sradi_0972500 [Sesamum radiatum]|uniref:Polyprotein n=1 Tax=Sesamum radiatum TaxID=300843 RepID=A0AAW2V4T1_SESRA
MVTNETGVMPGSGSGAASGTTAVHESKDLKIHTSDFPVNAILMGLNDSFDAIRSQILVMDPLPIVDKAYSLVLRVESQRYIEDITNNAAMMVRNTDFRKAVGAKSYQKKKTYVDKKNLHCDNCNRLGHSRDTCFKLHGFPDWFKDLTEQRKRNVNDSKAFTAVYDDKQVPQQMANAESLSLMMNELLHLMKGKAQTDHTQDQKTKRTVAVGKVVGKLYMLNNESFNANFDKRIKTVRTDNGLEFVGFLPLFCNGGHHMKFSITDQYRSMGSTVCELSWIMFLLQDFGLTVHTPVPFLCDNQAALHIVANPVCHERTKYLEIDCHIVRDKFKAGLIAPAHVPSKEQLADIFTKYLAAPSFLSLLSKLGLVELPSTPSPTCGGADETLHTSNSEPTTADISTDFSPAIT